MAELSNYEMALKAEAKRVVRCFQHYSSEDRASLMASHRQGYLSRQRVGEFYYVHPSIPDRAFSTRGEAARAGLEL